MMLPKFSASLNPQYHTVNDVSYKLPTRTDQSETSSTSTDTRDDGIREIISTAGKQVRVSVTVTNAEVRDGFDLEKEVIHPASPVDCYGFPDVEFATNNWLPPPPAKDTAGSAAVEEFVTEWPYSALPPPPPPPRYGTPARDALRTPATSASDTVADAADGEFLTEWPDSSLSVPPAPAAKPPNPKTPLRRVKAVALGFEQWTSNKSAYETGTEATMDMTSFEYASFVAKTPSRTPESSFFVKTPNTSMLHKGDVSFVDSVGNVTMDAFGFPVEASTPCVNKSMRAVPMCPRDSPVKGMRPVKSDPAMNRLIARAQVQAHYREPEAVNVESKESAHSAVQDDEAAKVDDEESAHSAVQDDAVKVEDEGSVQSASQDDEPKAVQDHELKSDGEVPLPPESNNVLSTSDEIKFGNAGALITKAKFIVTDDDVDEILSLIEDPNKTPDQENLGHTDLTRSVNNTQNVLVPNLLRKGSLQSPMTPDGSFDAQESSIEVLDSSGEIPLEIAKYNMRRKRVPTSKLRCTDENLHCNINFREVEKAMWAFMDEFDEQAGKCGYVIGCIERVPREVNMSEDEASFSLLGDEENLINKLANQHSVSLLESLTIDD